MVNAQDENKGEAARYHKAVTQAVKTDGGGGVICDKSHHNKAVRSLLAIRSTRNIWFGPFCQASYPPGSDSFNPFINESRAFCNNPL